MKTKQVLLVALLAFCTLSSALSTAEAQGTAFTYQGQLSASGSPASGNFDFTFALFNTNSTNTGQQIGDTLINLDVGVTNGLFIVTLNFGDVFTGTNYWLSIRVRTNGGASFTALNPLQELTPTPYAIYTPNAGSAATATSATSASTATTANNVTSGIAITNAVITNSVFEGNGGGLTNLNASQLSSGVVPTIVLPGFQASSNYSTVGGGQGNTASGQWATIGGGNNNTNTVSSANGTAATIAGGQNNIITNGYQPTIGGGYGNNASGSYATIGGGVNNTNSSQAGTIGGGQNNLSSGQYQSTVGGGYENEATNSYATVPGGNRNIAGGEFSFAAGQQAQALHQGAFVWADSSNAVFASTTSNQFNVRAQGGARFVTSGAGMTVDGQPVLTNNETSPSFSGTVTAAGFQSDPEGDFVVGGGNTVNGGFLGGATVSGGSDNTASGAYATIGGGFYNMVGVTRNGTSGFADPGTIGGGSGNDIDANSSASTIGGGHNNTIEDGPYATVGGGQSNQATNSYAAVPGEANNIAGGEYSFAAGQQAQALHQGAFVWADSQNTTFSSTTSNQFLIRAQGGVGINMNNPNGASLYVQGNRVPPAGNTGWAGSVGWFENTSTATNAAPALRVVCDGGTNADGALSVSSNGKGLIAEFGNSGTFVVQITNNGTIYATAFNTTSDRNAKEHFTQINPKDVLAKVAALPITQWNFKLDAAARHIGPMAQDFHEAFAMGGDDDKHISLVDEGGVALAAIQGLNQKLEAETKEKDAEIEKLKAKADKVDALEKQLNELKHTVQLLAERK